MINYRYLKHILHLLKIHNAFRAELGLHKTWLTFLSYLLFVLDNSL